MNACNVLIVLIVPLVKQRTNKILEDVDRSTENAVVLMLLVGKVLVPLF